MSADKSAEKKLMSMIEAAAQKRDAKHLRELLDFKPDLNTDYGGRILWEALGDVTIATMLVQAGAKVNMSQTIEYKRNPARYRFLHWVADCTGDEKYMQLAILMMDRGADINELDADRGTVLHRAIKHESMAYIEELVKRGADVEAANNVGENPIRAALEGIFHDKLEADVILPLLIEAGDADAETIERRGLMAFKFCLYEYGNFTEAMKVLLDFGVPINSLDCEPSKTRGKNTIYGHDHLCMPLTHAVSNGNLGTFEFLLDNGADINKQSKCGKTALTVALLNDNPVTSPPYTLRTVIQRGADIHNCNSIDGRYPIHVACETRYARNVKFLLNLGADLNVSDKKGKTPLSLVLTDKRFDSTCEAVVKDLALLLSKDIEVNLHGLSIIQKHVKAKKYLEKCSNELNKMMATPMHKDMSVFDLFIKTDRELSLFVDHADFSQIHTLFPLYSEKLESRIKLAKLIKTTTTIFHCYEFLKNSS